MARLASVSLIALAWGLAAAPALAQSESAGPEVWIDPQAAALGDTINGDLVEGDSRIDEAGLTDRYVLDLQAGTPVEIIMRSEAFDTYLDAGFLGADGYLQIASDDDGLGEGLNSRLRFLAAETGRYEIRAHGFYGGGAGAYSLSFAQGEPMAPAAPAGSIVVGGSTSGELAQGDATASEMDGGYGYDAYRFSARAGDRLSIIVRSDAFDPTVQVGTGSRWGAFNVLGYDDDGLGEGLNSRLFFTAPANDEYEIRVSSFAGTGEGAYTLELAEREPLPAPTALVFGEGAQGQLAADDAIGDDGMRYDGYVIHLAANQRILAVNDTTAFAAVMDLGTMDGGVYAPTNWASPSADSTEQRLLFTAPAEGDYIFRIGSYEPDAVGPYSLIVTDRGPLPPPPPPGSASVGGDITGALADSDGVGADERYFDDYRLGVRTGQRLAITLRSATYDTLVEIGRYGANGEFEIITSDDDSAGDLDSRAIFIPEANEDLIVRATSFGQGEVGDYTLSIRDLGPEPRPVALRVGRTINGELTDRDGLSEDDGRYDPFSFRLSANDRIEFTARSDAFDTLLGVSRGSGASREFLAVDDDGLGEGTNSRLVFTAPEDGEYELWVTAYDAAGRGRYTLESEAIGPAPEPQPIQPGATVEGTLEARDMQSMDGPFYDAFTFTGQAQQRVRFTMRSGDFDTFLLLGQEIDGSLAAIAQDDDGLGEGTDSRLTFTLPADGPYQIWASSYGMAESGAYSLAFEDMGPAPQPGSLVVGSTARGSLDDEDATDEYGSFYEAYRVRLDADEAIRIELTSNAFDTMIMIGRMTDGVFQQDAMDDDGLSDTNSRLDFTAPAAGEYIIRVRSYAPASTGDYALTVEPAPAG